MPCQLLSFQDFQMSAGLVLSNNTVIILQIRNYLTLLIGDSIIAGLSRYANIWKGYFQLLNAINCGVGEDRVQSIFEGVIIYHRTLISSMLSSCMVQTTSNTIL